MVWKSPDVERRTIDRNIFINRVDSGSIHQSGIQDWIHFVDFSVNSRSNPDNHILQCLVRRKILRNLFNIPISLYKNIILAIYHNLADGRILQILFEKIKLSPQRMKRPLHYILLFLKIQRPGSRIRHHDLLNNIHDYIIINLTVHDIDLTPDAIS